MPLVAFSGARLLPVRDLAEHDGNEEVGGIALRDEEEEGEHHRGHGALRDVLYTDKPQRAAHHQRKRAEHDDDDILVELSRDDGQEQHSHRAREAYDGVRDAHDIQRDGDIRRVTQLKDERTELHPEFAERPHDEREEEDHEGFVLEQREEILDPLIFVPRRHRGRGCRRGGSGLTARHRIAEEGLFGARGSLGGDHAFKGEFAFTGTLLRKGLGALRRFLRRGRSGLALGRDIRKVGLDLKAVGGGLDLVHPLLDLDDEHYADGAEHDRDEPEHSHRHELALPVLDERRADGPDDEVHYGGREPDQQPDGSHDVRPLLGVGGDDIGHGLVHVVGEGGYGYERHAADVDIGDLARLRIALRHPHCKHGEQRERGQREEDVRLVAPPLGALLLHGVGGERRQDGREQRADYVHDVAVQRRNAVEVRDLRHRDDEHHGVVDPAVAERVNAERTRLLEREEPAGKRLVPHRFQGVKELFEFFLHSPEILLYSIVLRS